jgi:hypothetical protein
LQPLNHPGDEEAHFSRLVHTQGFDLRALQGGWTSLSCAPEMAGRASATVNFAVGCLFRQHPSDCIPVFRKRLQRAEARPASETSISAAAGGPGRAHVPDRANVAPTWAHQDAPKQPKMALPAPRYRYSSRPENTISPRHRSPRAGAPTGCRRTFAISFSSVGFCRLRMAAPATQCRCLRVDRRKWGSGVIDRVMNFGHRLAGGRAS